MPVNSDTIADKTRLLRRLAVVNMGADDVATDIPTLTDIHAFIELLTTKGELQRIVAEVDSHLEIAAIANRVSKTSGGGKALLFERVQGYRFPVAINLFGSSLRAAMALGCMSIDTIVARLDQELERTAGSSANRLQAILSRQEFAPVQANAAPCMECAEESADLSHLPALQSWPADAGRFLTLPQVFTCDPVTGERNCGMYRMQIFNERSAGIRWRPGSDAARHYTAWQQRGTKMPVAVTLGGDPALLYAASAPLPAGLDEVRYAGFLRGAPLAMAMSAGGELEVPAHAEFVLEGYVEPGSERLEGPFGNHTGRYSTPAPCPVFHLTKLFRRREAIYPCTVVGPPPMENCWLAKVNERLILSLLRCDFPQIVDVNFPVETIFHGCALVAVRGAVEGGREMLRSLWQSRYLRASRLLVLVDGDVNVQNAADVYWTAASCVDPGRDVIVEPGRIGIDATQAGRGGKVATDDKTAKLINRRWHEYGIETDADTSRKG